VWRWPYLRGVSRTRTIPLPLPLDLRRSLAPLRMGRRDPTIRIIDDQVLRAAWTPAGSATLHVRVADGTAVCEAWGDGATWALDHAPGLLGVHDDLAGFDPSIHAMVARLARRLPGLRMIRSGQVTDVLLPTILGQKVTGLEAKRAHAYLVRHHGRPAPGPGGLRLPPPAELLAGLPYEAFHPAGVERTRAVTVIEACRRIDRLEEAAAMPREQARRRLTAVRGLGPWTAAIVERVAFGDADAVETGDYHLPNVIAWNLAREDRADDGRMLELLAPFAPHRGRVLRMVELAGQGAPRYGPRMSVGPVHRL
jgi:3-methyladenine DNA glycosylase/8-oxoguanine DNA glycosylase